uniref:Uncharacterized protein n=1 Tax=Glossina palpalis gambiensis TaxID=67801 RepID=A0A1B0B3M9_9MUSC
MFTVGCKVGLVRTKHFYRLPNANGIAAKRMRSYLTQMRNTTTFLQSNEYYNQFKYVLKHALQKTYRINNSGNVMSAILPLKQLVGQLFIKF